MTPVRRALVTGGAGFIGSHLIERLLSRDWKVTAMDNLSNGRKSNVDRFLGNCGYRFVEGDIADPSLMCHVVQECEPEVVYHLAALHFIPWCVANPCETLRTNVFGTQSLLDALAPSSVRKFVFTSTSDVYLPKDSPHTEEDPTGPPNIYGQSKLCCEQLLDLSRRRMPWVRFLVVRLFNVYGPGETNPHVIPDIFELLRKGGVLPLGNVDTGRDFVHVSDVADAFLRLADYSGDLNTFNLGTSRETTAREIVGILGPILGRELSVTRDEARFRRVDRAHLCADISKASGALGWVPKVGIAEGLQHLLRVEGFITDR
jgi:UDP-glucose 4-epimerase